MESSLRISFSPIISRFSSRRARKSGALCMVAMATSRDERSIIPRPWFLDLVPALVVILIAAHVFALVYWIYRLATDRQPQRSKKH